MWLRHLPAKSQPQAGLDRHRVREGFQRRDVEVEVTNGERGELLDDARGSAGLVEKRGDRSRRDVLEDVRRELPRVPFGHHHARRSQDAVQVHDYTRDGVGFLLVGSVGRPIRLRLQVRVQKLVDARVPSRATPADVIRNKLVRTYPEYKDATTSTGELYSVSPL